MTLQEFLKYPVGTKARLYYNDEVIDGIFLKNMPYVGKSVFKRYCPIPISEAALFGDYQLVVEDLTFEQMFKAENAGKVFKRLDIDGFSVRVVHSGDPNPVGYLSLEYKYKAETMWHTAHISSRWLEAKYIEVIK